MRTQVQLHVRTEEMHDEMLRSEGVIGGPMNQLLSSNDYFDALVNLATDADSYIVGSDLDEFLPASEMMAVAIILSKEADSEV